MESVTTDPTRTGTTTGSVSTFAKLNPRNPAAPPSTLINLVVALIAAVLVAAVVTTVASHQNQVFRSRAVVVIDQPRAIAESGNQGVLEKLSRLRGKYAGLVQTEEISRPVSGKLGLPLGAVQGHLSAAVDPPSLLMNVVAQASDARRAQTLAASAADELVSYTDNEQATIGVPAERRYRFSVVIPARGGVKIAPTKQHSGVSGALVGLVVLALVYAGLQALAAQRSRS